VGVSPCPPAPSVPPHEAPAAHTSGRLIHALIRQTGSMGVVMTVGARDREPRSRWNRMAVAALHASDATVCIPLGPQMFRRANSSSAVDSLTHSQPHRPPLAEVS
jgi:hypothetical protein